MSCNRGEYSQQVSVTAPLGAANPESCIQRPELTCEPRVLTIDTNAPIRVQVEWAGAVDGGHRVTFDVVTGTTLAFFGRAYRVRAWKHGESAEATFNVVCSPGRSANVLEEILSAGAADLALPKFAQTLQLAPASGVADWLVRFWSGDTVIAEYTPNSAPAGGIPLASRASRIAVSSAVPLRALFTLAI